MVHIPSKYESGLFTTCIRTVLFFAPSSVIIQFLLNINKKKSSIFLKDKEILKTMHDIFLYYQFPSIESS